MLDNDKYTRRQFDVTANRVTAENMADIARWCKGSLSVKDGRDYVKVPTTGSISERQSQAFVGDWVTLSNKGFKVFTNVAFVRSFAKNEQSDESAESSGNVFKDNVMVQDGVGTPASTSFNPGGTAGH